MRSVFVTILLGLLVAGCDGEETCLHTAGARCLGYDAKQFLDARWICGRMPAADDRPRFVVIAHPYDTAGNSSAAFEVLQLSTDGTLARFSPPKTFSLGNRAPFGTIAFTADAKLGLVPLDNGKVGVFSLDTDGTPTVIDPGFTGDFYADRIVIDANGGYAWIADSNTRANGGGIYRVTIGCDGMLSDPMLYVQGSSVGGFAFTEYGEVIAAARDIGVTAGVANDVHSLYWLPEPQLIDAADPFGDDNVIFSGFAVSGPRVDGSGFVLIGDSNVTGTNRVAAAGFDASGMLSDGSVIVPDITDPSGIAISPFSDVAVAVVTSSQPPGEGIYVLAPGASSGPWTKTEITYKGAAAQLPGDLVTIDRGALKGSVIVSELSNVRRLQFHADGSVTDEGSLALGSGLENIAGAIGVTP
jgi:hypothetical protein